MGQKLLNQIKKILRMKKKKATKTKKKITRTLVNLEVIQPKSTNYYYPQKPQSPPPYRRSPVDQEPQHNKQVRFLESPETHHQSQVRFLHPLYPKESNPHLHLDPTPWYHPPPQYQQDQVPQRSHNHWYWKETPQEEQHQAYLIQHHHLQRQPRHVHRYPQHLLWLWPHVQLERHLRHSMGRPVVLLPSGTPSRITIQSTPLYMPMRKQGFNQH